MNILVNTDKALRSVSKVQVGGGAKPEFTFENQIFIREASLTKILNKKLTVL